ncbi:MAG: 2-succinyl-5-enolpyruvyl-6-hydroxy-3-cyclohexene-1-carboxylic-acid synthase [Psychromonas sp.]|nr:2-succinyl-5-enolpyruvyl-6-hydroxy-3-cyclohexene-1-carboxylic-acid synthase [Psychromonas sp.]
MKKNHIKTSASNINLLWAYLFIEELIRLKVLDFCLGPGARSTPLTLAVANHPKTIKHLHFDERGLAFFALGLSEASQKPVAIITTSGTAVANLYPAIVEAKQSKIPLIIISADRPAQLINCGANQAIDQQGIFSNAHCFFTQIPTPSTDIQPEFLLTTIDQVIEKQKQLGTPVHFNFPISEPFYPSENETDYQAYLASLKGWILNKKPFTHYIETEPHHPRQPKIPTKKKVFFILARLKSITHNRYITDFAKKNHCPLFADIQSGSINVSNNIVYYDLCLLRDDFVKQLSKADIIIQFGDRLISKRLTQFIHDFSGEYWIVNEGNERIDPTHKVNKRFNCDITTWAKNYLPLKLNINKKWQNNLFLMSKQVNISIIRPFFEQNTFNEINIVLSLDKLLPDKTLLFIGNSMPIRLVDMFMQQHNGEIFTNRGASGIDGLLASAIGVAKQKKKLMSLLIGDLSFLYDLNSLTLLKHINESFIIILINNDGGSIFNLLPIPEKQKQIYYQMPHGYTFLSICDQFGLTYYKPHCIDTFTKNYQDAINQKNPSASLIEVCLDNNQTHDQLNQLKELIQHATL